MYIIIETEEQKQTFQVTPDVTVARQRLYELAVENEIFEVSYEEIMAGTVTVIREGDYKVEVAVATTV